MSAEDTSQASAQAEFASDTLKDLLKDNGIEVSTEILDRFHAKLVDGFAEMNKRFQLQDEKIEAQALQIAEMKEEIGALTNTFQVFVKADKRRQINSVINNVIIRSKEKATDISSFIVDTIKAAGGRRVLKNEIQITEIPHNRETEQVPIYRVTLSKETKGLLFQGLALNKGQSAPFSLSNETPMYLVKDKRTLDKCAYSIRMKFKDQKVKSRVSLRNARLILLLKPAADTEWFTTQDTRAQPYLETPVAFSEKDKHNGPIPTCAQYLTDNIQN
jgi:hypothetical protein